MAKLELACLASSLDGRMPRKRDNARPTIFPITSGRSELNLLNDNLVSISHIFVWSSKDFSGLY
jgi:hypothetical protein